MAASREPVVVGILATEGLPAELAEDIAEELPDELGALPGRGMADRGQPAAADAAGNRRNPAGRTVHRARLRAGWELAMRGQGGAPGLEAVISTSGRRAVKAPT